MRSIVIIPALNEEENIEALVKQILALNEEPLDCLVVDDHSDDGTFSRVKKINAVSPRVKVISNPGLARGLAHCYQAGFAYAKDNHYDWIIGMDADFSHAPADISRLLAERSNADWIVGSRYCPGGSAEGLGILRYLISRLANLYIGKKLNLKVADATSGFNCFKGLVLESIDFLSPVSEGFIFQVEMKYLAARRWFQIREIPIHFRPRRAGASKFSSKIVLEALRRIRVLASLGPDKVKG